MTEYDNASQANVESGRIKQALDNSVRIIISGSVSVFAAMYPAGKSLIVRNRHVWDRFNWDRLIARAKVLTA